MSGNDKLRPTVIAEVDCEDGLCSVARPLGGAALPPRKLGIATADRPGVTKRPVSNSATTGGSSSPAKRPFLVDLLHGNVELESFFKDE